MTKPYLSERVVSIIENIPPKGVSFSDFIAIIVMSEFCSFLFRNTKISVKSDIAKS